jgi:hypothetical protein
MTFAELDTASQAELCFGAISAAAKAYFEVARRHFDEPRHGAEHYLQAKLFDKIAEKQGATGYATLETSPKEVLSELGVAALVLAEGGIGSQQFDIVTGSIDVMGKRMPEVLIELKRDLNDGQLACDLLKLLQFNEVLKRSTALRLKTAISLGLRRTHDAEYRSEVEKRVRSAVSQKFPSVELIFKHQTIEYNGHRLLSAGVFVDLR